MRRDLVVFCIYLFFFFLGGFDTEKQHKGEHKKLQLRTSVYVLKI